MQFVLLFWFSGSLRVSVQKLDSTVCKEMSVSDTEVSDVTWTDNGTFNLSEGHTPQTENSDGTILSNVFSFLFGSCFD